MVDDSTRAFERASELYEQFENALPRKRAQCRAALVSHLEATFQLDADCSAMFYQYLCDEGKTEFSQLLALADNTLSLAQLESNFNAEVRAVYAIGRLILDQGVVGGANATIDICATALPKLRRGMEDEDLYDMWCLIARAAEVVVIDGDLSFRSIEIKAYQQARAVARQSEKLQDIYFPEARLLVLQIGSDIGTQQTKEQQQTTNQRVQAIVDDLQPLQILEWIDAEGFDDGEICSRREKEMELSDTICYIAVCMIHGHVAEQVEGQGTQLLGRSQSGGAEVDYVTLWL